MTGALVTLDAVIDWPFNLALAVGAVIAYSAATYVDGDRWAARWAALAFVLTLGASAALDLVVTA